MPSASDPLPVPFPPNGQGEKTAHIRKKISVYKKIYFRIYEKIFSHMRNFFLCARIFFAFRTASFFPAEGGKFSQVGKFVFQAWKIFFPRQENFPSPEGKRIALGKKKDRPSEGKRLPSEGRKNAVRTQGNFRAHRNKFSYVRKYFFLRTEILRLAHSGHSLGARRKKNEPSEAG